MSGLSEEEIEKMKKDARENKEVDKKKAERAKTRNRADRLIHSIKKSLKEFGPKINESKKSEIETKIERLQDLVDSKAPRSEVEKGIEKLNDVAPEIGQSVYNHPQGETGGATSSSKDPTKKDSPVTPDYNDNTEFEETEED